ncbi:hypothetical protein [Arcanobacterium hippocoleae]|uniref:Carrier domain-containing protein n=1 Tax=Arcanobacterium hippocoleae TaxID=149017 RepID=A0ABU1T103_9ACTO|nr:hypothetical protein [Arcanobacterium hippocoleae]MDR6938974.1 hypothetical protein [Arcanobacterium hippocoleae]
MDISQLSPTAQVALAQIRVALAEISPEIPETEIYPAARLDSDLRLDLVSKWALAVELERLTKTEIKDAAIHAAVDVEDFMNLIADSQVTQKLAAAEDHASLAASQKADAALGSAELSATNADLPADNASQLATAADLAALLGIK